MAEQEIEETPAAVAEVPVVEKAEKPARKPRKAKAEKVAEEELEADGEPSPGASRDPLPQAGEGDDNGEGLLPLAGEGVRRTDEG
jgi:hypothetical protein